MNTNEQEVTEGVVTSVLDAVDESQVEEMKALSNDEIIQRLENGQKELEKTLVEREQALEGLQKEMQRTQFNTSLAEEGLNEFAGLFEITDTKEQVAFIKNAVNQILVKNSYQPKNVVQQEQYTQAIQAKDVETAIGFKFANFFKK